MWNKVYFQGRIYNLDENNAIFLVVVFRYTITENIPKTVEELKQLEERLFVRKYVRSLETFYPVEDYERRLVIEYVDRKLNVAGVVWSRKPIFVSEYKHSIRLPAITIPFPADAFPILIYQPYSKFIDMLKEYLLYKGTVCNLYAITQLYYRIDKLRIIYEALSDIDICYDFARKDLLVLAGLDQYY